MKIYGIRYFIAATLSHGIAIVAVYYLIYRHILSGLLIGGIFGLLFGFVQVPIKWLFQGSKGWKKIVRRIIAVFLALVFSVFTGIGVSVVQKYIPAGSWSRLPELPSGAQKIVSADNLDIWGFEFLILDQQNSLHSLDCVSYESCDWVMVSNLDIDPTPGEVTTFDCDGLFEQGYKPRIHPAPVLPGRVVDSHILYHCGVDFTVQAHVRILDDGSVWVWWNYFNPLTYIVNFPVFGITTLLVSIAMGIWAYVKRITKSNLM